MMIRQQMQADKEPLWLIVRIQKKDGCVMGNHMDLDYEMISSHDENLFNTSGFVPKKEKIEEPDKYEIYNYPITASNFSLWNRLKTEGTGFNVKLGLIARVTDYWRLGLAFHTPTYYSMSDYYMASVDNAYTYVDERASPPIES